MHAAYLMHNDPRLCGSFTICHMSMNNQLGPHLETSKLIVKTDAQSRAIDAFWKLCELTLMDMHVSVGIIVAHY